MNRFAQLLALGCLAGLVYCYPFFEYRLTAEGMVQRIAFHVAFGLVLLSMLGLVFTLPSWMGIFIELMRRMPVRLGLFVLNFIVFVVVIFTIFTQWGVIATMLLTSLFILRHVLLPVERRRMALSRVTTQSIVSFWLFFFALGSGEVYFRFHPEQVGGGGGGNPALGQIYKGLYSINSHGLRDDEFSLKPDLPESRILMLGDSFMYGQGVAFGDCFPQQAEQLLNSGNADGGVFQVINGGKCGANTTWELDYLQEKGWVFEPVLVVLQFFANDIELTTDPVEESQNKILELFFRKPLRRSYVAFFLRYHFDQFLNGLHVRSNEKAPRDWLWGLSRHVQHNSPAWQECRQSLHGFATACREKGVPVVVVLFPHPGEPHGGIDLIHEAVAEVCLDAGLPWLDLRDAVKRIAPEEQIVTDFDHHPSAAYHAAAAKSFVDWLQKNIP